LFNCCLISFLYPKIRFFTCKAMTELIFLGTRGNIQEHNDKHFYHSSLLIKEADYCIQVDFGRLHRYELSEIKPDALLITHAHPDHYIWLERDYNTSVPVYLTVDSLNCSKFQPFDTRIISEAHSFQLRGFRITPYEVMHSLRCPTVGFRIGLPSGKIIVYNPDVVDIAAKDRILTEVHYYIGDGSAFKANLVRRRGDKMFGHTRIGAQVNWCRKKSIDNIIFTHIGKEVLENEEEIKRAFPDITLAFDGMWFSV